MILPMKIKRVLLIIVLLQAFLCTIEAVRAIQCHKSGSECWPWFFAFVANIPASVGVESFYSTIVGMLRVESFTAQTITRFFLYLLTGSVWWTLIVLAVRRLVRFFKKKDIIGDRS
jgi:hypothetical protein